MVLQPSIRQKIEQANAKLGKAKHLQSSRKMVYIAGKVGDLTDDDYYWEVVRKFAKRERELRKLGYGVTNPMTIVERGTDWHEAMRICIAAMMLCNYISPLADSINSPGATIEMTLAEKLGFTIVLPSAINRKLTKLDKDED